jgi:hypothetical protein
MREVGEIPDPRETRIARLKAENTKLRERLAQSEQTVEELSEFRGQAMARLAGWLAGWLAAQHEEIVRLREAPAGASRISRLPAPRTTAIGSCS